MTVYSVTFDGQVYNVDAVDVDCYQSTGGVLTLVSNAYATEDEANDAAATMTQNAIASLQAQINALQATQ